MKSTEEVIFTLEVIDTAGDVVGSAKGTAGHLTTQLWYILETLAKAHKVVIYL